MGVAAVLAEALAVLAVVPVVAEAREEVGEAMEEANNKIKGINESLLPQIVGLILKYKKPEKIVIFGSRASDNFEDTSDIDIAIIGKDWTNKDINIIKYNLDEFIKTPLKFDLLNFHKIGKTKLKENILREGRVIYDIGKD